MNQFRSAAVRCECGWRSIHSGYSSDEQLKNRCNYDFATHTASCRLAQLGRELDLLKKIAKVRKELAA